MEEGHAQPATCGISMIPAGITEQSNTVQPENRMRFTREVMEATRAVVGSDFPISFRFSADAKYPGGRDVKESQEIAVELEKMGADLLHVDAGCYESIYWAAPGGYLGDAPLVDYAAAIKEVVNIPVMAVGSLTPETAEKAIEEGKCDFVAFHQGIPGRPEMRRSCMMAKRESVLHRLHRVLRPCITSVQYICCDSTAGTILNTKSKKQMEAKDCRFGGGVAVWKLPDRSS
jgi:2,4-dienoyl-CoA reductase-like NADH-dependent reductase (Old Yellow Enzyme family)